MAIGLMPSSEQDLTELGRSRPGSQDPVATTTDNFPGSSLQRQTERLVTGDPRLSIAERYKNDGQHVSRWRARRIASCVSACFLKRTRRPSSRKPPKATLVSEHEILRDLL